MHGKGVVRLESPTSTVLVKYDCERSRRQPATKISHRVNQYYSNYTRGLSATLSRRSNDISRQRQRNNAMPPENPLSQIPRRSRRGGVRVRRQRRRAIARAIKLREKILSDGAKSASLSSAWGIELAKLCETIPKCPDAIPIEVALRINKLYSMVHKPLETSADLPSMPTHDDAYIEVEPKELKIVETWSYTESKTPQSQIASSAVTSSTHGDTVEESFARSPENLVESFAMPGTLDAGESRLYVKVEGQKDTQQRCQEDIGKGDESVSAQIRKQNEDTIHTTTSGQRTPNSSPLEAKSPENAVREPEEVVRKSECKVQVNEASMTTERNKLILELLESSIEDSVLRRSLKYTTDSARSLRLQQRLNCANKKIENTVKYLNKLIETTESNKKQRPLRIQVRKDLGQTLDASELSPTASQLDEAISHCEPIAPLVGYHTVRNSIISPAIEGAISAAFELQPEPATRLDLEPSTKSALEHPKSNIEADTRSVRTSFVGSLKREIPEERVTSRVWSPKTINNEEYSNKHPTPSYQADAAGSNIIDGNATHPLIISDRIVYSQHPPSVSSAIPHPDKDATRVNPDRRRHCPHAGLPFATTTNLVDAMTRTPVSDFVASNHLGSEVRNGSRNLSSNQARRTKQTANENSQGMFSRGNGRANMISNSPLRGNSMVAMPRSMYGQMTAQEYPLLVDANHTQQSTQSSVTQKVVNNSSSPYNTDVNPSTNQIQLYRDTLTNSETRGSVNASRPTEPQVSNLTKKKWCTRAHPYDQVRQKIISEQLSTLGNWAAQMTGNLNIVPDNRRMEDTSTFTLPAGDSHNNTRPVIDASYFNALANGVSDWPTETNPRNQKPPMQGYNDQSIGAPRNHPGNYMSQMVSLAEFTESKPVRNSD